MTGGKRGDEQLRQIPSRRIAAEHRVGRAGYGRFALRADLVRTRVGAVRRRAGAQRRRLRAWRSSRGTALGNSKASRCGRTPSSRPALMRTSRVACTMPPPRNALSRARVVQVRARTDVRHWVGVGEHPPLTDAVSTEAKNRVNRLKLIIASDLEYLFPTHSGHECVCGIRNSVARQIFWHGPEYSTGAPMRTWKSKS